MLCETSFSAYALIFQRIQIPHIVDYHQRDLEGQRIVKCTDIQSRALLQLLNTVHQRIAMHKKLT